MRKIRQLMIGFLAVCMSVSCMTPIHAAEKVVSQKTSEIPDDDQLKIASYNIASKGNKTKEIAQAIDKNDIDIIGMQEVDKNTSRNPKDMLKEIADEINYDYYFRKNIDYGGGEYGIGLLANGTLENKQDGSLESAGYEGRGWQKAEVLVGDKTVSVYNTHLTWEDEAVRKQQMIDVLEEMENDSCEYKILMGDFNA